jgi:hypothetical protein
VPAPGPAAFEMPQRRRFALHVLHPRLGEDHIDVTLLADLQLRLADLPQEPVDLDLWLESPGGHGDTAYRIALLLSGRATTLRVAVASSARSAATLLSLAADEIYMSDDAELGPLDAQISHANGVTSARDVVRNLELIQQQAVKLAASAAHRFRDDFSLPASEALVPASSLASSLIQSLITRVDPSLIFDANNLLDATERYAKRLLKTPYERRQREPTVNEQEDIVDTARRLVRSYPTHEFVIDRTEAHLLGLRAHPLSDYPEAEHVVEALNSARRSGARTLALEEYPPLPDPERWQKERQKNPQPDGRPRTGSPSPNSRDGLHDHPEPPRPGQRLRGRRRHAAVAEAAGHAQGPRHSGHKADATMPRWQPEERHTHRDVDLDDSWIWGLAPRPVSGHQYGHGHGHGYGYGHDR